MKHLLTLMLATGIAGAAGAQHWTYSDCVDYAREHNITLQKARLNELTADYDLEAAQAQWLPTLDFATSHGYTNSPWSDYYKNIYNSSYGFQAGWTVWNGGERQNTIKRNQLNTQIARLTTGAIFRTLETDLLQVYINILYTKEAIGIYQEAVKVSETQDQRGQRLFEVGKISKVDYAQLNSQYEQDKYALVNAVSTYETRCMELKKLLELGINDSIALADVEWTAEQVLAELPPIDESYQLAVSTDLELQSLELARQSAEYDINIARAARMPKISLNAGVATGYSAPGDAFGQSLKKGLNETVGLTLSIPIFDNKKAKTAVAKAKVNLLDADLDNDKRLNDIAQLVENWYIDTTAAQARYSAAATQYNAAQLTEELTNERFSLGYINILELMTAHNSYIEAQHALLQAKYMAMLGKKMIEYYRTASVNLP